MVLLLLQEPLKQILFYFFFVPCGFLRLYNFANEFNWTQAREANSWKESFHSILGEKGFIF